MTPTAACDDWQERQRLGRFECGVVHRDYWHPCTNLWRNTDKWQRGVWKHIDNDTICRPGFMGRVHTYRGVPLKKDGPDPLRKGGASAVRAWGCCRCYVWAPCSAGVSCR